MSVNQHPQKAASESATFPPAASSQAAEQRTMPPADADVSKEATLAPVVSSENPTLPPPPLSLSQPATVALLAVSLSQGATRQLSRSAAEPSPSAATIPGYEILSELGRGGLGVVYKARQSKLNRLVALN